MFQTKKITRIGLLMIISELLIALFVVRWLQSEFTGEKMALEKTLSDQFMAAKSRVMDSVISKNLIEPMLNDPNGFKVRTIHADDRRTNHDSVKIVEYNAHFDTTMIDSLHPLVYSRRDSLLPAKTNIELRVMSDTTDKLLYRGVKMFISKVSGSNGEADFFERHLEPADTNMLKSFFAENLQQHNLSVKAVWINDRPVKKLSPTPFYFESLLFENPYGVRIERYNEFLFREILPQILFALLLLTITGAAFFFSFRSLRNQLRLATMKDDFISNVSHELKTPLATVKVAVEAMQAMDPAEKKETIKEYLGMASQELTRLDMLVSKVMNSILLENGSEVFQFELVSIQSLINQTLKALQLHLAQYRVTVTIVDDSIEKMVYADKIHLQGIFYNLIDNSLKYGNEPVEIVVQLSQTASEVIVEFSDNGPGIPDEYLDKVFEKFFRVPSGNRHNVKGHGLGLNYVSQVMKQHHGTVSVKNSPTAGCAFTLKFPKHQ